VAVTALDHILLLSDDVDATADFYHRALGLTIGARPDFEFAGHWLYAGGVVCLHIAERRSYSAFVAARGMVAPSAAAAEAIHHIAFAASDYDAALARLRAAGVDPFRNATPGGETRQLFFNDPDGLAIEVNFIERA
jgi:catechol 2,3-dioxygenase-like lactoylglutathione lyase family enzyme